MAGLSLLVPGIGVLPAQAAQPDATAVFSGGTGTVKVGDTVYAKAGGALTLTVTTASDTKCVDVEGAFVGHQTSATGRTTWTFTTTAGSGDGASAVTATGSKDINPQGRCTGNTGSAQASFTLDNTGPTVAGTLSPGANAAGWRNSDVAITWSATDTGSGVGSGPTPATDSQQQDTAGTTKTATATDRLGNTATGSVTVRLDKSAPTVTGGRTPAANADGWNNTDVTVSFTCEDNGPSGIKSCPGPTTLSSSGVGQSVSGTAVDNADNSASTTVGSIAIDKVAPTLTGTAGSRPNGAGWYNDDVTVVWDASDALSGIAGAPTDSTVTGEGTGLTAGSSVSDRAGNTVTASSEPVSIDRTAPTTAISGASATWTSADTVEVSLSPSDALSGVASTTYAVDGGEPRTGTTFTLSTEGDHVVTYASTDRAGNVEATRTAQVRIDRTAPGIRHSFTPLSYTDGAWTSRDVTVTFHCTDSGSGVAGCTDPVTRTTEGAAQQVVGTATDNVGHTATDTATVSIDKTSPTVTGSADRQPNAAGWYDDDVTVSFAADDALSGVASAPAATMVGEGRNQSATGTATDAAGNSASDTVSGINVDKTSPTLTASPTGGWHTDDVVVDWTCTDLLSGVATQPVDETLTGEGDDLSSTATCTDRAGNVVTETVRGITIDRTPPTTTHGVPTPLPSGWYGGPVEVRLTAHDSLSGVATTFYSVDGGAAQVYAEPFTFSAKGEHTITYWSEDRAGNVEDGTGNRIALKLDGNAPTTTVVNPISPASGWFVTSGIPVAFRASDAESGVAATYYTIDGGEPHTYGEPFTADLSTGRHTIAYWSVDIAGNVEAKQTTDVKVDTIAPSITGSQTPAANSFGWNNSAVDVMFSCADADSGINGVAGCAGGTTLTNEGAGQAVTGDAVDVAGNRSSTSYGPVNIDKTRPTLTGVATTAPNAAGWYTGDVTVRWVGDDALSGIDPDSQPANSTVSGEGANLGAGPVTIKDKAGNVSSAASVTGIRIDRTAPVVTGATTTQPNASGWYNRAVTVNFTCTDNLSGIASCPTSQLVSGDGGAQSVTSGTVADVAGNVGDPTIVGGINVDGSAPTSTADNRCTKVNGWCTGTTAHVVITATDQDALSGVQEIHYRVDGGEEQVATGSTTTVSVPLDGSGAGTVSYWAVDKAGNVEPVNSVALKWDNIAPTVTHGLSPAANANDWNNADVTVTFYAKDDDKGSGVDPSSLTEPVTVSTETPGLEVHGFATDTAGNVGSDKVTVRLDKTAPTISGAVVSGPEGSDGWYVGPVTVRFTCADDRSGIATCPDDVKLTANGPANSATGTATDRAGNTTTTVVAGIKIDQEKPTLTAADVTVAGASYTVGNVPTARCSASDDVSGVASCTVTVTGGNANGVGTFSYTATATDNAGNSTTVTGTYRVTYRFDGFLQPINDTAHQVGTSTSIFKAGSTVPVKFQLRRADGSVVQASAAPVWLAPAKGGATSALVDEAAYSAPADSGSSYRWDSMAQQHIYNWKTDSKAGNYWRIGVRLDDAQTYYVNIGLR